MNKRKDSSHRRSPHEISQEILHAHGKLHDMVREVLVIAEGDPATCHERDDIDRDAQLLEEFKDAVVDHFECEERDGFMDSILFERPEFSNKVIFLKVEHREIGDELEAICVEFRAHSQESAPYSASLMSRIKKAVSILRAHEGVENELLQRAFYRDSGPSD